MLLNLLVELFQGEGGGAELLTELLEQLKMLTRNFWSTPEWCNLIICRTSQEKKNSWKQNSWISKKILSKFFRMFQGPTVSWVLNLSKHFTSLAVELFRMRRGGGGGGAELS